MCTLYLLLGLMRIYDTPLKLKNKALSLPYPTESALFGMTMRHEVAYPETFGVVAYCESTLFLPLYNMGIHLLFFLAYYWILNVLATLGMVCVLSVELVDCNFVCDAEFKTAMHYLTIDGVPCKGLLLKLKQPSQIEI